MALVKYDKADRAWASKQVRAAEVSLDSMPYTKAFEELFEAFNSEQLQPWTRPDVWKLLLAVRKQGLGRKGRRSATAPELSTKQRARLKELMPRRRGEVDRLPYTSTFEQLYRRFSKYLAAQSSKNDVWLSCLRIAKTAVRPAARPLLEKSLRRLRAAINAFNRIGDENRLDESIVAIHHALEMLIKAALVQNGVKIIDEKTGHFHQMKPCIRLALHHHQGHFLSHPDAAVLKMIDAVRGEAYHAIMELDESEAFVHVSSGTQVFGKILWEVFWKDLADAVGSLVLPISTIPLADTVVLLDRKREQVKKLIAAGESARALGAAKSVAILEKAASKVEHDDARVTESEAKAALKAIRDDDDLATVFPNIAALPVTQQSEGATIFIGVKRRSDADAIAGDARDDRVFGVLRQDFSDTHPFRFNDIAERVGISKNRLLGVIKELELKSDPDCYHEHGPAKATKTPGWSQKTVTKIRAFAESYDGDLLDLWRKHYPRRPKK